MAALVRPEAGRSTAMGGGAEDGDGGAASARGEGTNKVSVRQGRGHAGALPTSLRAHRIPTTRRTCKSGGQHMHNARNRSGDKQQEWGLTPHLQERGATHAQHKQQERHNKNNRDTAYRTRRARTWGPGRGAWAGARAAAWASARAAAMAALLRPAAKAKNKAPTR